MEPLATPIEIARVLRIEPRDVYELVAHHGLPVMRVGRRLRFKWAEIAEWLRSPPAIGASQRSAGSSCR